MEELQGESEATFETCTLSGRDCRENTANQGGKGLVRRVCLLLLLYLENEVVI